MEAIVGVVDEHEVTAPSLAGPASAELDPAALPDVLSATTNSAPRFLSARGCHEPELDIQAHVCHAGKGERTNGAFLTFQFKVS